MSSATTIQKVRDLCGRLVQPGQSAEALAQELGSLQPGGTNQYTVTPDAPEFQRAMVAPAPGSDEVNFVRVTLAEALPLPDLEAAFGEYQATPRMPKKAPTARFTVDAGSATHRVALLVPLDGKDVTEVTLRRDVRLA